MEDTMAFASVLLYRQFLSYCTEELKKLGLNFGQLPFLLHVGKHPDCTQAELTRYLRIDWGYCQRSVAKLAEGGFLIKENRDGQNNRLRLTPAGQNAFDISHRLFSDWDRQKLSQFSEQERRCLLQLLRKLTAQNEADK